MGVGKIDINSGRKISLRIRFILAVLIICTACLVIVSCISYYTSYTLVKKEATQKASQVVLANADEFNNWLLGQAQSLHSIVEDLEINGRLDHAYLSSYLSGKYKRCTAGVIDYYIGFEQKEFISATGWVAPPDYDCTAREWYQTAVNQDRLVFTTPYLDADTHQMVITISEPIKIDGDLIGVAAVDIKLDDLMKLAETVRMDQTCYPILLDNEHNFMIHPQESFRPTAKRSVNAALVLNGKYEPLIERINSGQFGVLELKDYDGVKRYFVLSRIKSTNWTFGIAIPSSEFTRPLNKLLQGFAGALALSFILGLIIILPITNRLLKPIEGLTNTVRQFARKDFNARAPVVYRDEVGELSQTFNQMADIIQEYNQGLEQTVAQRTASIRNLLDNAGQGFLSFGNNLLVEEEFSAECSQIFNDDIGGRDFAWLLYPDDAEQRLFIKTALARIFEETETFRRDVYLSLLPPEIVLKGRSINFDYKIITEANDGSPRIMVVLTDITEKRQLEQQMEKEKQLLSMVVKAAAYNQQFSECVDDYLSFTDATIFELVESLPINYAVGEIYRNIHTFKGNFSQFDMVYLVAKLNDCEGQMAADREKLHALPRLEVRHYMEQFDFKAWLDNELTLLKEVLGERFFENENKIVVAIERLQEISRKMVDCLAPWECKILLPEIKRLKYRPFQELIKSYPESTVRLAERIGKQIKAVEIEGGDVLVDTERFRNFCKSLVHVFRNAVDHGIETPEERLAGGKPIYGRIRCEVKTEAGNLRLIISDDGKGINSRELVVRAMEEGLIDKNTWPDSSEALNLIFADNISTKDTATEISGRGIGMAAVKEETEKIGGSVEVQTAVGKGTTISFTIPLEDHQIIPLIYITNVMNPLLETTVQYFTAELGQELVYTSTLSSKEKLQLYGIAAFSEIKGIFQGRFILSVDKNLGLAMLKTFSLENLSVEEQEEYLEDVMTEITNVILGNSIRKFAWIEELLYYGIPVILSAENMAIKNGLYKIWSFDLVFTEGRLNLSFMAQEISSGLEAV